MLKTRIVGPLLTTFSFLARIDLVREIHLYKLKSWFQMGRFRCVWQKSELWERVKIWNWWIWEETVNMDLNRKFRSSGRTFAGRFSRIFSSPNFFSGKISAIHSPCQRNLNICSQKKCLMSQRRKKMYHFLAYLVLAKIHAWIQHWEWEPAQLKIAKLTTTGQVWWRWYSLL